MSIKFKLALPTLAGLALIILLIQFFWQPLQLEKARSTFEKHTQELLISSEAGIIPHLLDRDLGSLFSNMEQLEKSYKNRWLNITLYNENKKRLYPIFIKSVETIAQDRYLIHVVYPLKIEGTNLGHLELDTDWGIERLTIIKNLNDIRDMIIWMLALVLLITTLSQYQIIYRPLKKLGIAANKIKHGNFNAELPGLTQDEIGELTKSFSAMLVELTFQKNTLDHHAIVSAVDKNGVITHINNNFLATSGYAREALIGKTHKVIKSNSQSPELCKEMWETITRGEVWHGDVCNQKKTGEKYWVSSTIVPFLDEQGVPERYISIQTDITVQKNAEEQLRYMANHDTLTGLPTRRLGKENLFNALTQARRDKKKVAVLFIDLDGFKAVNDSLGHDAGDLLLVGVSERLKHCVRETDSVARVGGDEFIVIISKIDDRGNATLVTQKIIDALALPFTIDDKEATIGASIGIALYPDHEQEPEALIRCADEMMYAVKRRGKKNFAFYGDV